jgi:hypothetical protein
MRRCVWQHWNYAGGICVVALLGAIFLWSRSKPAKHLNVISQNVTIASARGGTPRASAYYASPLSPTHLRPEEYRMSTKPRDANSPQKCLLAQSAPSHLTPASIADLRHFGASPTFRRSARGANGQNLWQKSHSPLIAHIFGWRGHRIVAGPLLARSTTLPTATERNQL